MIFKDSFLFLKNCLFFISAVGFLNKITNYTFISSPPSHLNPLPCTNLLRINLFCKGAVLLELTLKNLKINGIIFFDQTWNQSSAKG